MAEIGIAASIVGIASFGVQLTSTLYEFGSTAHSAKEQTDYIARHVSLYSGVLELLADRLEDDEPIHSETALDLVEDLYDQSDTLFMRIEALLPRPSGRRDDLSFRQKIAWNFKKSKVELLVGEIDYLKSTVHLLVRCCSQENECVRTEREAEHDLADFTRSKSCKSKASSEKERDALNIQCTRAHNAIIEHVDAADKLPDLEAKARTEEQLWIGPSATQHAAVIETSARDLTLITQQDNVTKALQLPRDLMKDPAERRSIVLQRSFDGLQQLLGEWTTLSHEPPVPQDRTREQDLSRNEEGPQRSGARTPSARSAEPAKSRPASNSTTEPITRSQVNRRAFDIQQGDPTVPQSSANDYWTPLAIHLRERLVESQTRGDRNDRSAFKRSNYVPVSYRPIHDGPSKTSSGGFQEAVPVHRTTSVASDRSESPPTPLGGGKSFQFDRMYGYTQHDRDPYYAARGSPDPSERTNSQIPKMRQESPTRAHSIRDQELFNYDGKPASGEQPKARVSSRKKNREQASDEAYNEPRREKKEPTLGSVFAAALAGLAENARRKEGQEEQEDRERLRTRSRFR